MARDEPSEASDSSTSIPSTPQSQSEPSLSRSTSFSRLNAQAPEFVPARPPPRSDPQQQIPTSPSQQPPRLLVPPPPPPPPPPGIMHVYPPPASAPHFHVPIHNHVSMPAHMVPVQNHPHPHPHALHPHPHQYQQSRHIPVRYHTHKHQYYGRSGFAEQEVVVSQVQQPQGETDHGGSSKNKLSEEATHKLLNQVEYYFSDLNLATTDHLMRFITKDPEGYVPISVVASFKKIKALISSHSQLANVLRNSTKLVVSEDGKKVRRKHPMTETDVEELQSRVIVAENLPEDHCHQNLMKVFSAIGSVKNIRTCQPQTSSSGASASSRASKADSMLYSNKLHAFVEYESVQLAEKAVAELNDEGNWRSGLRVRLMLKRTAKSVHARGKKETDGVVNSEEDDTSDQLRHEKPAEESQHHDALQFELPGEETGNDKDGGQRKGRSRGRGKGRGRSQHHNRANIVGTPPSTNSNITAADQPSLAKQPPGPRMPDGTRGFSMGRGKPVAINTTT